MTEFSFIHAADLHLDAPFRGLGDSPGLSQKTGDASAQGPGFLLREATFIALERLTELCIRSGADFLLLAGDVYNSAESSLRSRLALRDAFLRLEKEGIGVFLVHGNHDPLSAERGVIPWPDNVTVFGRQADARPAFRRGGGPSGPPIALIHGVSHMSAKESQNLARRLKRSPPTLLEPETFQIGLVHCALSGMSGGHKAYAPCTFSDLAEAEMEYWALGHVHACRLLDHRGRLLPDPMADPAAQAHSPLAAYSGSTQGLHVNETGPHGCLLIRVNAKGRPSAQGLPLAPVQWEQLVLEPGPDIASIPALERLLLEKLEGFGPRPDQAGTESEVEEAPSLLFPPQAIMARVVLSGRSPLDHELRRPGAVESLQEHVRLELAGSGLWLHDLVPATRPPLDVDAALARQDLAAEVLRAALDLRGDPEHLPAATATALDPLFRKPRLRKILDEPEPEELASLVEEAAFLCLDLLGPDLSDPDATGVAGGRDAAGDA